MDNCFNCICSAITLWWTDQRTLRVDSLYVVLLFQLGLFALLVLLALLLRSYWGKATRVTRCLYFLHRPIHDFSSWAWRNTGGAYLHQDELHSFHCRGLDWLRCLRCHWPVIDHRFYPRLLSYRDVLPLGHGPKLLLSPGTDLYEGECRIDVCTNNYLWNTESLLSIDINV